MQFKFVQLWWSRYLPNSWFRNGAIDENTQSTIETEKASIFNSFLNAIPNAIVTFIDT